MIETYQNLVLYFYTEKCKTEPTLQVKTTYQVVLQL